MSAFQISQGWKPKVGHWEWGDYLFATTTCGKSSQIQNTVHSLLQKSSFLLHCSTKHIWKIKQRGISISPLYGPDSMMPSVVEAKLLEVTQDSDRFRGPGPLGKGSYGKSQTGPLLTVSPGSCGDRQQLHSKGLEDIQCVCWSFEVQLNLNLCPISTVKNVLKFLISVKTQLT